MAKSNEQFLVRLEPDLIARLKAAAEEYGGTAFDSGNKVAADVLERYLKFWIEIKKAEKDHYNAQFEAVRNHSPSHRGGKK